VTEAEEDEEDRDRGPAMVPDGLGAWMRALGPSFEATRGSRRLSNCLGLAPDRLPPGIGATPDVERLRASAVAAAPIWAEGQPAKIKPKLAPAIHTPANAFRKPVFISTPPCARCENHKTANH